MFENEFYHKISDNNDNIIDIRNSYVDHIVQHIRKSILQGDLNPGDKIIEVKIAEELGISRAPIREALQALTHQGLVISIPQKGKFVANPTAKEIFDSYVVCGILEGAAVVGSLKYFTNDVLQALNSILETMKVIAETDRNLLRLAELDTHFHNMMYERSENKVLRQLSIGRIRGIFYLLFVRHWEKMFLPEEIYARHKELLECIKKKNKASIELKFRQHYASAGRRMAEFSKVDP